MAKRHRVMDRELMKPRKAEPGIEFSFAPFLTGSHRFGIPSFESDVDLVVMMEHNELRRLIEAVGEDAICSHYDGAGEHHSEYHYQETGRVVFRFGVLNLIVCIQPSNYFAFKAATQTATDIVQKRGQPMLKEEAADLFTYVRKELGIE